jgi:hypothetical protein
MCQVEPERLRTLLHRIGEDAVSRRSAVDPLRRITWSILRRASRPTARLAICRFMPPRRARSSSDARVVPSGSVSPTTPTANSAPAQAVQGTERRAGRPCNGLASPPAPGPEDRHARNWDSGTGTGTSAKPFASSPRRLVHEPLRSVGRVIPGVEARVALAAPRSP